MNGYDKHRQLFHSRRIHRNPEQLRKLLGIAIPESSIESESYRYKKCAHPKCGSIGTIDRPLDLHHIIPRSQSKLLINNFINHIYLCGDLFPMNHHKSLHGESTPGLKDWENIGFFGEWSADHSCEPDSGVDGAAEKLLQLADQDQICLALIVRDPVLGYDYAIRKGVFPVSSTISVKDIEYLKNYFVQNPPVSNKYIRY